jgi:hypothetical protein
MVEDFLFVGGRAVAIDVAARRAPRRRTAARRKVEF